MKNTSQGYSWAKRDQGVLPGDEVAEELGDAGQQFRQDVGVLSRISDLVLKSLELSDLLSHRPDDLGKTLAPKKGNKKRRL